jgi:hypothetical protein
VKNIILAVFVMMAVKSSAQAPDSIFFNLYTDSLKKGTYNYINVDGKFSDGRYLPMTSREIKFSSSGGKFDGNSLFIDSAFKDEKVTIKVILKADTTVFKETIIYIKRHEDVEKLKTVDEILNNPRRKRDKTKKGKDI